MHIRGTHLTTANNPARPGANSCHIPHKNDSDSDQDTTADVDATVDVDMLDAQEDRVDVDMTVY